MADTPTAHPPVRELETITAAELMKEAAASSLYDAMKTELDGIDSDTDELLKIADRLEKNGSPRKADTIRSAVDRIWDSAQLLFQNADYDKAPGSLCKKYRQSS